MKTKHNRQKPNNKPDEEKSVEFTSNLISKHGAMFRTKLVENLKPSLHFNAAASSTKYITKDITKGGGLFMDKIMTHDPYAFINFTAWTTQQHIRLGVTKLDRRKNRTLIKHKAKKLLEQDIIDFLHYFLHNKVFWIFTIIAGLTNIISQVCWDMFYEKLASDITSDESLLVFYALIFMDHMVFFIFLMEVVLWCFYDWKHYIRSYNFWVTVVALLSIGYMVSLLMYNGVFWLSLHGDSQFTSNWSLRKQQRIILLCQSGRLILCSRIMLMFKQSEIILLAVIQALPSLIYVSIMMALTTVLYWLLALNFFAEREKNVQPVFTKYVELGLSEGEAMFLFLFRLFTFDHFLDDLKASVKTHGGWSTVYIISWMVVSNYIFANLFAAVLINNFGAVRKKLVQQYRKMQQIATRIEYLKELGNQLKSNGNELRRKRMFDVRKSMAQEDKAKEMIYLDTNTDRNSTVLAMVERIPSDQEIPYSVRSKMRVHNPPVCDIKTYLQNWTISASSTQLHKEFHDRKTSDDSRGYRSKYGTTLKVIGNAKKFKSKERNKNKNAKNTENSNFNARSKNKGKSSSSKRGSAKKSKGSREIDNINLIFEEISQAASSSMRSRKPGRMLPRILVGQSSLNVPSDFNSLTLPGMQHLQLSEGLMSKHRGSSRTRSQLSIIDDGSSVSDITADLNRLGMTHSYISRQQAFAQLSEPFIATDSVTMDKDRLNTMLIAIKALKQSDVVSLWAKDTLFEYFKAIEQLFENLEERRQLITLANQAVVDIVDVSAGDRKHV